MGEVKRYDAVHIRYEDRNIRYGEGCEVKMVAAQDYDALRAEIAELVAALEFVGAKVKSSGRCHPGAVQYLLAEGLEAVDAALAKHICGTTQPTDKP